MGRNHRSRRILISTDLPNSDLPNRSANSEVPETGRVENANRLSASKFRKANLTRRIPKQTLR